MNEQTTPITNGTAQKVLANFAYLSDESLRSVAEALGLKMELSQLHACLDFYKKERLSDPTVGELLAIDTVFSDLKARSNVPLIASFMTNDQTVAETYADLMARRNAVDPDYQAPCSLPELLDILPTYAKGSQAEQSVEVKLFCGKERFVRSAAEHYKVCVSCGNAPCEAAIGFKDKKPYISSPEWGNAIYAVLKSFNNIDGFEERLASFTVSADVASAAKQIDFLDGESVITLLSQRFSGVSLNTAPYERVSGQDATVTLLNKKDLGVLITAAKEKAADMLIAAQELGLRVILLGSVSGSMKISALSPSGQKLSLDLRLLRSPCFSYPVSCEADSSKLTQSSYDNSRFPVIDGKRYKISSAEQVCDNAFISGYNSVLYTYSLALLGGSDSYCFAGAYTLDKNSNDKKALGRSLELILGAYRAQCELGIYDGNPSIIFGDGVSLRFHALTEAKRIVPSKINGIGSYIHYLEPLYRENGLPDTEDLKKMHAYIAGLVRDGVIISACPTGEDLLATLDKMSEDTCVEYVRRDQISSHFGGFIVESTQRLQGSLIARTTEKPVTPEADGSEA